MPRRSVIQGAASASEIAVRLALLPVPDVVDVLNELDGTTASEVLSHMPEALALGVFNTPHFRTAPQVVKQLPLARAATILATMSEDRSAHVIRRLEEEDRHRLLAHIPEGKATALRELARYEEETAGGMMTTEFMRASDAWSVGETLEHLRQVEHSREFIYAIYVVSHVSGTLLRVVSLRWLLTSNPDVAILTIAPEHEPVAVSPATDREEVARLISKYDLLAVPVIDSSGKMLGIVTIDDIMDVMAEEVTEDAQKFGGMGPTNESYLDIGFLAMIRKRGGWLAALFMGEMLTASAMQHYEADIANAVVLTLFIPLIMSSGGNSGSQATSLIIRALALEQVQVRHWWRVALRELPTGITLGLILGLIGVLRITVWQVAGLYDYGQHWQLVAATVGTALVAIVTFGSLVGSLLPFVLKAFRFDPASASAPFVATLVDVSGIVIYFTIALFFLSGTLL